MRRLVAGIDIGNATTETALAQCQADGTYIFVAEGLVKTTGTKGTFENLQGIISSLKQALDKVSMPLESLDWIALNEAAPVIGDVAMETITATIITESTMIGHNPDTPGGLGIGIGISILMADLLKLIQNTHPSAQIDADQALIVVADQSYDFLKIAETVNEAADKNIKIQGIILQKDDGVLVNNRLNKSLPIIDEVSLIEKVPLGVLTAIEVAPIGKVIEHLSNPYGIATVFKLDSEQTKMIVPIARALIGNRSAVVIKTKEGDVQAKVIPAGKIDFIGKRNICVNVDAGAAAIMEGLTQAVPILDIQGEAGTHVGGMLERVRQTMSQLTGSTLSAIKIQDLLAIDTFIPQKVQGGLAGEFALENAVGIAAMVKADRLQMSALADLIHKEIGVITFVGGIEANMAISGALTTPGAQTPVAVLDLGAGSTDAAFCGLDNHPDKVTSVHLAGAGNMVSLMIATELGLDDLNLAEDIKKYPLARVESLFHIRHEDGSVQFFDKPLDPTVFARTVILHDEGMQPIPTKHSLEAIRTVRRNAKEKIFVTNTLRALKAVCPNQDIRQVNHVIIVGGSALDFEIPQMVTDALSHYAIIAGRANVRAHLGPRNAVATGLVLGRNHHG